MVVGGTPAATGASGYSDDFVYSNGALSSTNWSNMYYFNMPTVTSSAIAPPGTAIYYGAFYSGGTFNNDQWSMIKMTSISANAGGPSVRGRTETGRRYHLITNGTSITVKKFEDGGGDYTVGSAITQAVNAGDYLKLSAAGTGPVTLKVYVCSTPSSCTQAGADIVDSSGYYPSTDGKPGFEWPLGSDTTNTMDSWSGGDL